MGNKEHEILPSPQVPPEQQPPREAVEVAGAGYNVPESEEEASKAVETPSFAAAPPQAPPPPQTDQSSTNAAASDDNQALPPVDPAAPASVAQSNAPQIADDVDLIEKEWVNKAKEIVEQTKEDPYNQNREIVRLRADYMKKRYNKDIKLIKD